MGTTLHIPVCLVGRWERCTWRSESLPEKARGVERWKDDERTKKRPGDKLKKREFWVFTEESVSSGWVGGLEFLVTAHTSGCTTQMHVLRSKVMHAKRVLLFLVVLQPVAYTIQRQRGRQMFRN